MANESSPTEGLLTPIEASQYLRVAEKTLTAWRCTQRVKLPFFKVGRLVRYARADLDQMITERRHEAG